MKVGVVKTGTNCCSSARSEGVSSMGRLPVALLLVVVRCETQTICQERAGKPTTFRPGGPPQNLRNLNLLRVRKVMSAPENHGNRATFFDLVRSEGGHFVRTLLSR